MDKIIVSRHPATVEFIRREKPEFKDSPVTSVAMRDEVMGKDVAGNLPLHLAALAARVWAVEFSGSAPRGAEYTLADMDAAGAYLAPYRVYEGSGSGYHCPTCANSLGELCHYRFPWTPVDLAW